MRIVGGGRGSKSTRNLNVLETRGGRMWRVRSRVRSFCIISIGRPVHVFSYPDPDETNLSCTAVAGGGAAAAQVAAPWAKRVYGLARTRRVLTPRAETPPPPFNSTGANDCGMNKTVGIE